MDEILKEIKNRLLLPAVMLVMVWVIGTTGYFIIGKGEWSLLHCAYMTAITVGAVGYDDFLGVTDNPISTIFTMTIIVFGLGIVMYCLSSITAFIVEGGLNKLFKERKMLKRISKLEKHFIVAGAGSTGHHVIKEMHDTEENFVVIDGDPQIIKDLQEQFKGIHFIEGDATDDDSLENAGIKKARGLVACLSNDKDNLYLTVSAKNLNPNIMVVARAVELNMKEKLKKVGADYVVSPNHIGGLRMASEVLRPHVVTFLDRMLRAKDPSTRVGEATIREGTQLAGKKLLDSGIKEKTGLLVVAVMPPGEDDFIYNPNSDHVLVSGSVIIVIGNVEAVEKLNKMTKT